MAGFAYYVIQRNDTTVWIRDRGGKWEIERKVKKDNEKEKKREKSW